ncbi:MAG: S-layer homology domain-containing protein [Clostridia bacterium]|nr:S-layer homology domain-containing protein [Clostridia bacterium]
MKFIHKIIASLTGLLIIMSAGNVYCAPIDNATADELANVEISGQIPDIEASTLVFAEVLTPKTDESDIEDKSYEDLLPYIAWIGGTMTDAFGNYKLNFALNPELSGSYSIRIKWAGTEGDPYLWQNKIIYISPNKNNEILEDVNNVADYIELKTVIDDNIEFFDVKKDDYVLFPDSAKQKISSLIYSFVPYADIDGFMRSFSVFTLSHLLSECDDAEIAFAYLNEYITDTAIEELNEYYLYETELEEDSQKLVAENLMKNAPYDTMDSLYKTFSDSVILSAFNSCRNTGKINSLLNLTKDYMDISLSKYNSLNAKSVVNSKLCGKNFESIDEIVKAFEKAVKDATKENSNNSKPAKKPSGGGGGGYTYSPILPDDTNSTENKNDLENTNNQASENTDDNPRTDATHFKDVSESFWGYEAIEYLWANSIVNGDDNNMFYPDRFITREEFCKMLILASGVELWYGESFDDVSTDTWYSPYIFTAFENGFVSGIGGGVFGVGKYITRQDMALMLYNVFGNSEISSDGYAFDDNDISDYAKNAVAVLSENDIVHGKGDNLFFPKDNTTRAEAAKVIYEIMKGESDD